MTAQVACLLWDHLFVEWLVLAKQSESETVEAAARQASVLPHQPD
jgi:hypothetical protein